MRSAVRDPRRALRRRILLGTAGVLFVVGGVLLFGGGHPFESVPARAARLSREHGITIGYGDPSTFYLPPFGPEAAKLEGIQMEPANLQSVSYALDGIEESLTVYPPGFVAKLVRGLFVCGDLLVDGKLAGGATGAAWFVLAAPESLGGEGIRLTAGVGVHHELSSFVLRRPNVLARWMALEPPDWKFTTTLAEALQKDSAVDPPPETGFLSAYGSSTAENDFNTYAERMFTQPESLRRMACEYEAIATKLSFIVQAYAEVDANVREPLRRLGLSPSVPCDRSARR